MKWDALGGLTQYRLVYKLLPVRVSRFDGVQYWVADGRARGVLIEVQGNADTFYTRPENLLFTRQQVDALVERMSNRMKRRAVLEPCDCGCEMSKPADPASAAWQQAASLVRCEPYMAED
ncbi:MAG: hypothetical protein ACK5S6_04980 [bacterium]|jgi:hypothetical protein